MHGVEGVAEISDDSGPGEVVEAAPACGFAVGRGFDGIAKQLMQGGGKAIFVPGFHMEAGETLTCAAS